MGRPSSGFTERERPDRWGLSVSDLQPTRNGTLVVTVRLERDRTAQRHPHPRHSGGGANPNPAAR